MGSLSPGWRVGRPGRRAAGRPLTGAALALRGGIEHLALEVEAQTNAAPLLAPHGTCLFLKGTKADDEVAAAQRAGWRFEMTRHASRVAGGGAVLELAGISREAPLVAWPLRKL